ncbi:hypothetical protein KDW_50040 [Dictyobacter vulcani]|uniref:Uncharacterized protein n=1 Tax=Dictyobacter vulcani TaxID=2607529 RepID=A0A5J4KUG7_9CHLR|nr:hypothetical protein KDW_50040 [Dictyobacter vulcani]
MRLRVAVRPRVALMAVRPRVTLVAMRLRVTLVAMRPKGALVTVPLRVVGRPKLVLPQEQMRKVTKPLLPAKVGRWALCLVPNLVPPELLFACFFPV